MVELLSDAMARRRLRASREQMVQLTRAARSKRMELEAGVVAAWYDANLAGSSRGGGGGRRTRGERGARRREQDGDGRDRRSRGSRSPRSEGEGRDSMLNHLGSRSGYGRSGRTHAVRNAAEEAMRAHEQSFASASAADSHSDAAATLGAFMQAFDDLGELALNLSPEELARMSEENDIMTMLAQAEAAVVAVQNGGVVRDDRQAERTDRKGSDTGSGSGSQYVDSDSGDSVDSHYSEEDVPERGGRGVAHHARVDEELGRGVHLGGLQAILGDALTRGGGRTADVVREKHGLHARDTANYAHRDYDQERRAIISGARPTATPLLIPQNNHTNPNATSPQSDTHS